ncbi:signal peptidase I [Halosolutus amylolyticus]|uniref:Signal peptidase I n=1 Tax=Halosolutus amylolyticus TaxID=2932267 RepID=A0ABD5PPY9_9EURY|nr:signal peptidase I [Halosolutus amylolyticus]
MSRVWIGRLIQGVILLTIISLVIGQLLGQPVLLGFVKTGSMEPTIETGDGFIAIPSALAGDPETGDVVVFEAEEIDGGGLTTHRIVDETDQGYVTRGDANPFTDQDGGEPPVQDAQVVATTVQVGDSVVTIPHLGTLVMGLDDGRESVQTWLAATVGVRSLLGTTGLAYLLLGLSAVAYTLETVRERRDQDRESRLGRDRKRVLDPRVVCGTFAVLVVVAATAAMIVPAGSHSYDVVSSESPSERPLVIEHGTTTDLPYTVANTGAVPVVSYFESDSDRVAVDRERVTVGSRAETDVTVSLTAPADTGYYQLYVTERRYLHVLPLPVLDFLYGVHPWIPIAVIDALFGGTTYAVGRTTIDTGRYRGQYRSLRSDRPRTSRRERYRDR